MGWSVSDQMDFNREFFSPESIKKREAMKQAGRVELQGTYDQRAMDERNIKGTFDQNARLKRQMEGTFDQNAELRREIEGPWKTRHQGELEKLEVAGDIRQGELDFQYGPNSIAAKDFGLRQELGRGELTQGKTQLDIMGDSKDAQKKIGIMTGLAQAQKNAQELFPQDPKKAQEYYEKEAQGIYQMFPEITAPTFGKPEDMPRLGDGAKETPKVDTKKGNRRITDSVELVDRYTTTMNTFKDPARFLNMQPKPQQPQAPTPPQIDLAAPYPLPTNSLPGGGMMNPSASGVNTQAIRKPMPIPGRRVVAPMPSPGAQSAPVRAPMPRQPGLGEMVQNGASSVMDLFRKRKPRSETLFAP